MYLDGLCERAKKILRDFRGVFTCKGAEENCVMRSVTLMIIDTRGGIKKCLQNIEKVKGHKDLKALT
jgi:hypothetical protein